MRWVIRLAGVVLGLVALFLVALVLVPRERVAQLAAEQFEASTGRALTISGEVRPSVWPRLGVRTGPVTIANAPWSDEGPMLEAAALEIGLDTVALMTGAWRISRIALEAPVIRLERSPDGQANWDLARPGAAPAGTGEATPAPSAGGGLSRFALDEGVIHGGRVVWRDGRSGASADITALEAQVSLPEPGGPADLTVAGQANGRAFAAEGTVQEGASFLSGRVVPLRLSLVSGDARVAFDGQLGTAPAMAEGRIDAALGDLADLMALVGQPRPDLPQGLGREEVGLAGRFTLADGGTIHLREGQVSLDGNRLAVEADLTPGEARPRLEANLRAEALDLSRTGGSGEEGAGPAGAAGSPQGWSKRKIDASALGKLDARIALAAGSIDLGRIRLGATKAIVSLDRGRAVADLREAAAYGGSLAGQVVVNARDGLSLGADLALKGLATEPLLADLAGFDRLATRGDVTLKLLGSGTSAEALARSLSGEGSVAFGKGEMRGLDLAGMVRTLDAGYVGEGKKTIFDRLTASFAIENGVLRNEDLVLAAPLLRATGAGRLEIGARTVDYRFLPRLLPREDGTGGVSVPVLVTGPWAKPSFRLDMEALVRQPVEREMKQRLEEEAAERLGVVPDEGESLEDAAKRRAREALEDEAGRALNRLLGGD
ncbi:AsmA family protein [Cereibacter sphaeroides]|uniref:AsmA family protein n=1 Tax=Cereibacter sphaeroides TaxID=1063 RepID=UPI001F275328|nr:AsmA family protein [Cereibacter sphaeroides]MCE6958182.1 AsmA family protein [Cereibacter sphaeroides]MCE6968009.1 AsmA family protein [Cereibacter sphaeroides]MCE6972285.1 AsmA family protein [Cereibacter sphaeroides]